MNLRVAVVGEAKCLRHGAGAKASPNVRIDGFTDYWLKISYKGYEGWIFGGYAYAERGGPKYEIPEEEIKYKLGWY